MHCNHADLVGQVDLDARRSFLQDEDGNRRLLDPCAAPLGEYRQETATASLLAARGVANGGVGVVGGRVMDSSDTISLCGLGY